MLIRFYRIKCRKSGKSYVGKTKLLLTLDVGTPGYTKTRLYLHESALRRYKNEKSNNCGSFDILEAGDYLIELIEAFEFETDNDDDVEIRIHEQLYIELERDLNPGLCCNMINSYTSKEDTEKKNKSLCKVRCKTAYDKNPKKFSDRAKAARAADPEKFRARINAAYAADPEKFRARKRAAWAAKRDKELQKGN